MSEIASAYVSLIPSFRGGTAGIAKQLGPATEEAGKESGTALGKGMLSGLAKLGLGASIAGLFTSAISANSNRAELAAKLGLNPKDAKTAASVAGKLYAGAFSDDMGEINDAIKVVSQNLTGVGNGKQLQNLTGQALSLSKAFGTDVAGNVNAASQLIRTGLAKNAQQAFDIIAAGEQNGADKAGDLLDTFNEYGVQFKKLGLDGPHALGLIQQGLQGGARDSDVLGDALKEFSILAVDGSTSTAAGFKALGLDARAMTEQIAAGGPRASAGLQLVLDRLRGIKDPAKQSQAAVALFGGKAEDLGSALYKLNPATALAAKGMSKIDGASKRVTANMGKSTPPLEALQRQFLGLFNTLGADLLPVLKPVIDLVARFGKPLGIAALAIVAIVGAVKAWTAATAALAAVQGALNVVLAANPLVLIITGIVALAAAVVVAYNKFEGFRAVVQAVWAAIKVAASAAFTVLKVIFAGIKRYVGVLVAYWRLQFTIAKTIVVAVFQAIRATISAVLSTIRAIVSGALNAIRTTITNVTSAIRRVWSATWGAVRSTVSGAWSSIRGVVSGAINAVYGTLRAVGSRISAAWSALWSGLKRTVTTVVGSLRGIVSGIWDGITSGLKGALNGAISVLNSAIHFINSKLIDNANKVPFVDIPHIPEIPALAKGGIVPPQPGGRIVRVAEAGQAEAVIPLDRYNAMQRGSGPGVHVDTLNINGQSDPVATARTTVRRLAKLGST